MRPYKPLVAVTLVVTAWGVGHDVLAYGRFINGDGDERTPPYIAMAAASAQDPRPPSSSTRPPVTKLGYRRAPVPLPSGLLSAVASYRATSVSRPPAPP